MTALVAYVILAAVVTPCTCLWLAGARRGRTDAQMPATRPNVIVHPRHYDQDDDVA